MQIVTSPNIAVLDTKVVADLCAELILIDISPSTFIATGDQNVLGVKFKVINPLGVVVKDFGNLYDTTPATSGGVEASISIPVPTIGGGFQTGLYKVISKITDADGTEFTDEKTVSICAPNANYPTRKYGSLSAILKGVCSSGRMYVIIDGVPNYGGVSSESQVNDITIEYPTSSGESPLSIDQSQVSVILYEGVYKVTGEICATYNTGNNVFVRVKYKIKKEKNQKCVIDFCCVYTQLEALGRKRNTDCTEEEKNNTANTILEVLWLLRAAELAADCGEDPSDMISEMEGLLGCSCTCNCNEGVPIINSQPSQDVVVTGCNVTSTTNGLTKTYNIDNYDYVVTVNQNGGALTVSAPQENGCTITYNLTFNIANVYAQIKQLAASNPFEWNTWGEIVNNNLDGIDPTCIGLTMAQWNALTIKERIQAIIDAFCNKPQNCKAELSLVKVQQLATIVQFQWQESGVTSVDIYFDGILLGNVLGGVQIFEFDHMATVDTIHTYSLVPKCADGSNGTPVNGTFELTGKTFVAQPEVYSPYLQGAVPYDLITNLKPLPLGITAEWHTQNNVKASTLVADPSNANAGVYYVFAKDTNGFYSDSTQVQLVADSTGSCSAPQALSVVPIYGGSMIQFMSAAYPPPMNSYTVKRRLKSDSDIPASYTTIGSPVWNTGASRWTINDMSALENQLYVYRAFSNCGATAPYIDFDYANIKCPELTLTEAATSVDYEFPTIGGGVDKVEVSIYSDNGYTLVHKDTHNAPFGGTISGSFVYLNPNKTYYVGVKAFIGTFSKICPNKAVETMNDSVTLTLDYVAGYFSATLSDTLPEDVAVSAWEVQGSTENCVTADEMDSLPSNLTITAGQLGAEMFSGGLTYLSTYYKIVDVVAIVGETATSDGDTFLVGDITVTLKINRTVCGYYPA